VQITMQEWIEQQQYLLEDRKRCGNIGYREGQRDAHNQQNFDDAQDHIKAQDEAVSRLVEALAGAEGSVADLTVKVVQNEKNEQAMAALKHQLACMTNTAQQRKANTDGLIAKLAEREVELTAIRHEIDLNARAEKAAIKMNVDARVNLNTLPHCFENHTPVEWINVESKMDLLNVTQHAVEHVMDTIDAVKS
jgi:hypothetical protein